MKEGIHPEWYPEAKVICNGEVVMTVGATKPELQVEIYSGNHPFYTGQQRLVDTEGQVERFMRRLQRREEIITETEELDDAHSPLAIAIGEINLGTRAEKALVGDGIETVGDLLDRFQDGDDALLSINGVGQKALIDIKKYLRSQNLID
ncbi:MAG: 50S ribosomal protein L31 [Candidatus Promineifilaceae bacterium]